MRRKKDSGWMGKDGGNYHRGRKMGEEEGEKERKDKRKDKERCRWQRKRGSIEDVREKRKGENRDKNIFIIL